MATKTAILAVNIVADGKKFTAGVNEVEGKLAKFQGKMDKLTLPAAAILAGLTVVGKKFIDLASDAEQMQGGMEAVFKDASGDVDKFAKTSADRLGLSGSAYNALAAQIGTSLKGAGVATKDLAKGTDTLITQGADLASVFGGTTTDAVNAMSSAFRGQFDPLEKYGIIITASMVSDRLKAKGLDKLTGAALAAAKQQETSNIISEKASEYAGNFGKEADTLAGQQERLTAKFEDFGIKLGTTFLPILTQLAQQFSVVVDWVTENSTVVLILAGVIGGLATGVLLVNGAMKAWIAIQGVLKGATMVATAVQWAYNAAMLANPIGLIITAVVLLIAAIVLVATQTTFFQDVWAATTKWCAEAWANMTKWISDVWNGFTGFIFDSLNTVGNFFGSIFAAVGDVISLVFLTAKVIAGGVIQFFIDGFENIVSAVRSVMDWVGRLFSGFTVPGWLRDVMSFMGVGATGFSISGGFDLAGLEPGLGATGSILGLGTFSSGSSAPAVTQNSYNITVNGALDPNAVARQIDGLMTQYDRQRGARPAAGGFR